MLLLVIGLIHIRLSKQKAAFGTLQIVGKKNISLPIKMKSIFVCKIVRRD